MFLDHTPLVFLRSTLVLLEAASVGLRALFVMRLSCMFVRALSSRLAQSLLPCNHTLLAGVSCVSFPLVLLLFRF